MQHVPTPSDRAASTRAFILKNLALDTFPRLGDIRLYTAHPASRLSRLLEEEDAPASPYWAYQWAGGAALARYLQDRPEVVAGRRVLDLGSGSGLVAIAAAKAGASRVIAADIDPNAAIAIGLNADLNGVVVETICGDLLQGPSPDVEVMLVGDLFYDEALAMRLLQFLDTCLSAGVDVLVGDPGRAHLPRQRLQPLADYRVDDFGEAKGLETTPGAVFRLLAAI